MIILISIFFIIILCTFFHRFLDVAPAVCRNGGGGGTRMRSNGFCAPPPPVTTERRRGGDGWATCGWVGVHLYYIIIIVVYTRTKRRRASRENENTLDATLHASSSLFILPVVVRVPFLLYFPPPKKVFARDRRRVVRIEKSYET